jgi:osmoprotectant transport system substrate-binding protein
LVWLAPSKVNNANSLAMRREDAAERGITSISDLAAMIGKGEAIRVASTLELSGRPDRLKPLQQTYGFAFMLGNVVGMAAGAVYTTLRRDSEFDVGVVFVRVGGLVAYSADRLDGFGRKAESFTNSAFIPSVTSPPVV